MDTNNKMVYTVYIEDKFHQPLCTAEEIAEYRFKLREFNTYSEAVAYIKDFLDKDFESIAKDCKNKDEIQTYWAYHGEVLYITPTPVGIESFSSRDYFQEKINNYTNIMDKKMDEKLTTEENQDLIHMAQESVNKMNKNVLEDNCVFGKNIRNALKFATKTHQGYQNQVRKGKIPLTSRIHSQWPLYWPVSVFHRTR